MIGEGVFRERRATTTAQKTARRVDLAGGNFKEELYVSIYLDRLNQANNPIAPTGHVLPYRSS